MKSTNNEDTGRLRYNGQNKSNSPFNGRIQGSSLKRHHAEDSWQKRLDDGTDNIKHNYTSGDNSLTMNSCPRAINGVHGSQHFKNSEALLEVLKRNKHNSENRGHSIGYSQNSTDGNRMLTNGNCSFFFMI